MTTSSTKDVLFLIVTDRAYFAGTVACVNSIFHHHPDAKIVVVNHEEAGLNPSQIRLLQAGGVEVMGSSRFATGGRHVGGWELKAYASCDLADRAGMIVGIDSDCVLCSPVDDVIARAYAFGRFTGGRDGDGVDYDASYEPYGIVPGTKNPSYMSTSIYFCSTTNDNRAVLRRWAECNAEALYNGKGPYAGHGDQGILNAVLFADRGPDGVDLLDNAAWSQHWTYWSDEVVYDGGVFHNASAVNGRQRSLHCGGTCKFWEQGHREQVTSTHPRQALNYAWWLYLFWFGRCRDWSIDPFDYVPKGARHICGDLVHFLGMIRRFDECASLHRPDSAGLISRLIAHATDDPTAGRPLDSRIEALRRLPRGAWIVQVGFCDAHRLGTLALSCLDLDMCFFLAASSGTVANNMASGPWSLGGEHPAIAIRRTYPSVGIHPTLIPADDAPRRFADGGIDALLLDATLSAEDIAVQLRAWAPKLRRGGILFGVDPSRKGVREVVDSVFPCAFVQVEGDGPAWIAMLPQTEASSPR